MDVDDDPFFLELLFNDVVLVGLLDTARSLERVEFLHDSKQSMTRFCFVTTEPSLCGCIEWESSCDLGDVWEAIGVHSFFLGTRCRSRHFLTL